MSRAGALMLLLYLHIIGTYAMPHLHSTHTTISLAPASQILQTLFDQLLAHNPHQAKSVLDHCIESISHLGTNRNHINAVRHRQLRQDHIDSCRIAQSNFRNGQNGPDILQTMIIDHLILCMSIRFERALLLELMLSIYFSDVVTILEIPAIPWGDDELAALLLDHAVDYGYYTWQSFLLNPEESLIE